MTKKQIYEIGNRTLIEYSGEIKKLNLEGLILPMTPELILSFIDNPVVSQILVESRGENLIELADKHSKEFQEKYKTIYKGIFPFIVPSRSAHIINGHSQRIAKKLIYAVPFDASEKGEPFFDLGLLEETLNNAINVAENNNIKTLGIPSLLSAMYMDEFDNKTIMKKTAEVSEIRLLEAELNNTSLEQIYLLKEDPTIKYKPLLMTEENLN